MRPENETQAYEMLLCGHLESFIYRLRLLPPDKWDWTPDPAAPTARTVAVHAWQWLICDRQHIAEPDAAIHPPIPDAPPDNEAFCDAFAAETANWRKLLRSLTMEQLDRKGLQFNFEGAGYNVRGFVCHMIQNVIYKHGQFSELFFALGLDGKEPYEAPFPNPIYEEHCWQKPS